MLANSRLRPRRSVRTGSPSRRRSGGRRQVESITDAEDHVAPRERGRRGPPVPRVPYSLGRLNGSLTASSGLPGWTGQTMVARGGIRSGPGSAISKWRWSAGSVSRIVSGCVGGGRKPPVPAGLKRDPSGVIAFSRTAGRIASGGGWAEAVARAGDTAVRRWAGRVLRVYRDPGPRLQDVRCLPPPDMGLRPRSEALCAGPGRGTSSGRAKRRRRAGCGAFGEIGRL